MSMFSQTATRHGGQNEHIIEFKAGRSNLVAGSTPDKRKVVAEKTKGLVIIKQTEDRLMHFCWKNRETGAVVDDLIIFPGDADFVRVKECPDGKVFVLKFKTSMERRLYWLQDSDPNVDKNLSERVHEALNNPPTARSSRAGAGASSSMERTTPHVSSLGANSEMNPLGRRRQIPKANGKRRPHPFSIARNLDQSQLMQLLQFMGSQSDSTAAPSSETPAPEGSANPTDIAQLRNVLEGLRQGGTGTARAHPHVDLSDVITGERVLETVRNNEERLTPHLPEGSSREELEETVRAAQFRQASDIFGHAFQTGQLAPVLQQFGLPEETAGAAQNGDLLEFAKKLTSSEQPPSEKNEEQQPAASPQGTPDSVKEPTPKRGKPDDDQMDLD